jgi:hypothetical protein
MHNRSGKAERNGKIKKKEISKMGGANNLLDEKGESPYLIKRRGKAGVSPTPLF